MGDGSAVAGLTAVLSNLYYVSQDGSCLIWYTTGRVMVVVTVVPIYRLMHIDNLPVCFRRGGMHAPNHTPSDGLQYRTIHNVDIQHERSLRPIPCGQQGTVHDYVSFYFGVLSPMLLQLCTGRVDGYDEGPSPLVYAVSSVQAVIAARLHFVFSDGQGIAAYTDWYDKASDLKNNVDWNVVSAKYWACTVDDPDRQRRKQAEFLVHRFVPWRLVQEIGVLDSEAQTRVEAMCRNYAIRTLVRVRRQWYY